jgi:DNA repair protein RadA/Sms
MLQLAGKLASAGTRGLYATGAESAGQIADRGRRLGVEETGLLVLAATSLPEIERSLETEQPSVVIIDSIQTIHSPELSSAPGSVSQVRHCSGELMRYTKSRGLTAFLIGHVTREGSIAGPKVLEHLVDAVIYFEGDRKRSYRLLRAVKNRFGSTNELGVFEMTSSGLTGVAEASRFFLHGRSTSPDEPGDPGTAVAAIMEGTRPFLVEIQALVSSTRYGYPQRSVSGFDSKRLPLLLAVLEKRCGFELGNQDVYVNVAGGARTSDPGADLAVCLAVASSLFDKPVRPGVAVAAEVGLGGELRAVSHFEWRLKEALNLGFAHLAGSDSDSEVRNAEYLGYEDLGTAVKSLLEKPGSGGSWA